jgi:uncharacterized protein (DUF1800 family)
VAIGVLAVAGSLALAPAPSLAAEPEAPAQVDAASIGLLNRVTWGVKPSDVATIARLGPDRWLDAQLHPPAKDRLPPAVQAQIDAWPYLSAPVVQLAVDVQAQNVVANEIVTPALKAAARQVYNKALEDAVHQAALRSVLRDIYSPDQLKEQMTWFWFNHFNVHQYKSNLRLLISDYEDQAIRPRALGRFRDLLEATLRHPAMLRYLDNADNAAGHINENYAREIMELHTMGVGSGYTQQDVQELARVLTGVGIDANPKDPKLPPNLQGQLIRSGLFEFNPARHDYGDKMFLGHLIRGRGFGEVEEALDILCRQPATARHISRELATYFVSDNPSDALVQRMSQTFLRSDGDIAQVLGVMFHSPEFRASLGTKFKDPAHFAISAVRLAYGDKPIANAAPILNMLGRMGEGLYSHETPDGYSMIAPTWDGPGQLETRFELARQMGSSGAGLFRAEGSTAPEPPGAPSLATAVQEAGLKDRLSPATRTALAEAASPADWNTLLLSSPDFMRR